MNNFIKISLIIISLGLLFACNNEKTTPKKEADMNKLNPKIQKRIDIYAKTKITGDISHLTDNQKKVIKLLADAGHLVDEIFWQQTSPSAIPTRDSLKKLNTPEAKQALEFVMINYGPYDRIDNERRYIGQGPEFRPKGGTFYPIDMTKKEFEEYIKKHPEQKDELESQYTVVVRDKDKLKAVPYSVAYPLLQKAAMKLEEAANFADNLTLKNYLILRANAFRTNDYFPSDMAWMDIKDNDIDVIIGPIENYEDALYNYKSAFECVVMVKDNSAAKKLILFNQHVKDFEDGLPYAPENKKYIRKKVGNGTQINFVNVLYFGGDSQTGVKTIACSLPNDPRVREAKGGGKSTMYKNLIEAKFDKMVLPIAKILLEPEQAKYVDKNAFMTFITLHEVSHTLGRGFVYGNDKLTVRKSLKDRFSAIEETKADILGMYNQKHLLDLGIFTNDDIKKSMMTYLPGLYRSIRFGAEEAHGKANLIQLNFLREAGAITKDKNGKFVINEDIFFDKCAELARIILTTEAEGDYDRAGEIIAKYAVMTDEIKDAIAQLKELPRDLDTSYDY